MINTDLDPIQDVIKKLELNPEGSYENGCYVIKLKDSDEYARLFSQLNRTAVNLEEPEFGKDKNNTTVKITNYFEATVNNAKYNIFLIADFIENKYQLKIKEIK